MMTTTCLHESTAPSITTINLLVAFEPGERSWKLGFTTGLGQRPRIRQVPAGAVDQVREEIARAKVRLKLPAETGVISCRVRLERLPCVPLTKRFVHASDYV